MSLQGSALVGMGVLQFHKHLVRHDHKIVAPVRQGGHEGFDILLAVRRLPVVQRDGSILPLDEQTGIVSCEAFDGVQFGADIGNDGGFERAIRPTHVPPVVSRAGKCETGKKLVQLFQRATGQR